MRIDTSSWLNLFPTSVARLLRSKAIPQSGNEHVLKKQKKKTKRKKKGQQYRKHNILVDGRRRRFIEKATAASINQRPDNRITNTDDTRPDADDVIKAMEGFQNDDIVVIESPESRGWPLKNEP